MKKCTGCGQTVKDEDVFCTNCGSTNFIPLNNVAQPNFGNTPQQGFGNAPQNGAPQQGSINAPQQNFGNAPQNGMPQQNFGNAPQNGFGVPTPSPVVNNAPAKKSKTGLIIGLSVGGGILLILVILAIIGATAEKKYQSEGYGSSSDSSYSSDAEQTTDVEDAVAYTNGQYDPKTRVYTNEWADLNVTLPEGWQDISDQKNSEFSASNMDCGLYAQNTQNDTLAIGFCKYPSEEAFIEREFLDGVIEGMSGKFDIKEKSEAHFI